MDIIVGAIPGGVRLPDAGSSAGPQGSVEATVLAVREPRGSRRGRNRPAADERRRRSSQRPDPPGARVVTLLVTDPSGLPPDVGSAPYRVLLRFVRQGA